MSLSKSNTSNQSSISNLLTLSRDSESQQIKSHKANIYYKKFISKLGFLFRIETQDLDALYNKIVQCVNQNSGIEQSNDTDITELIQLAKKLKYNHNLMKNMVQVLDLRFLKNNFANNAHINDKIEYNSNQQHKNNPSNSTSKDSSGTQNAIKTITRQVYKHDKGEYRLGIGSRTGNQFHNNAENVKRKFQINLQQNGSGQVRNTSTKDKDEYGAIFDNTLQKAKQSFRRRKQLEEEHRSKNDETSHLDHRQVTNNKNVIMKEGRNKFEQRVNRIFDEMNKIKGQLHKIENSNPIESKSNVHTNDYKSQNRDSADTLDHKDNKMRQQYGQHDGIEQKLGNEQENYYLSDNTYIPINSLPSQYSEILKTYSSNNQEHRNHTDPNIAIGGKISLKDLYKIEKNDRQEYLGKQVGREYNPNKDPIRQPYTNYQSHSAMAINSPQKQEKSNIIPIQRYQHQSGLKSNGDEHDQTSPISQNLNVHTKQQSQKSYSVSNGTIIDRLSSNGQYTHPNNSNIAQSANNSQLTYTLDSNQQQRQEQYNNTTNTNNTETKNNEYMWQDSLKYHKTETHQSMATTLVNTSTQFNNHNLYEAEASNPNSSNSDTYNKISNYHNNNGKTTKNDSTNNDDGESGKYSEMIHRNQRSREKISTYMQKLEQRNRILKQYVSRMQKTMQKQKAGHTANVNQVKKSELMVNSLSNQIYTEYQPTIPRYAPTLQLNQTDEQLSTIHNYNFIGNNNRVTYKNLVNQRILSKTNSETILNHNHESPQSHTNLEKQVLAHQYTQSQASPRFRLSEDYAQPHTTYNNNDPNIANRESKFKNVFQQYNQQAKQQQSPLYQNNNTHIQKQAHRQSKPEQSLQAHQSTTKISNKQQKQYSLQLASQKSLNSIEDLIQKQHPNHNNGPHLQFVIPYVTNNSLFEQTRNVQSKIELSDDRGYKLKVPGEEIEKIKNRVNDMFKKIKSIRDDENNPLKNLEIIGQSGQSKSNTISNSINNSVVHDKSQKLLLFQQATNDKAKKCKTQESQIQGPKRLQFKTSTQKHADNQFQAQVQHIQKQINTMIPAPKPIVVMKHNKNSIGENRSHQSSHSNALLQSSLIDQIRSSRKIQRQSDKYPKYNVFQNNVFHNSYPVNKSIVLQNGKKHFGFSFIKEDQIKHLEDSYRMSKGTANFGNSNRNSLTYPYQDKILSGSRSRDSNFSFNTNLTIQEKETNRYPLSNFRTENFGMPNNFLRGTSASLSQQKRKNMQFPIPKPVKIPINRVIINHAPLSTRSSSMSIQSKKSSIERKRALPSLASTTSKTNLKIIKNPPPLPPRNLNQSFVPVVHPSLPFILNNGRQKKLDVVQKSQTICKQGYLYQNKMLTRVFSQHVLDNSYVSSYSANINNYAGYNPINMKAQIKSPQQNTLARSKQKRAGIQTLSNRYGQNSSKNSGHRSKSSTKSNGSRRGLNLIQKQYYK